MDEIASAQSAAGLLWLRSEVVRRFTSDPHRTGLERLIDEMMLVIPLGAPRPARPGSGPRTRQNPARRDVRLRRPATSERLQLGPISC
jgi:hypothetical protein